MLITLQAVYKMALPRFKSATLRKNGVCHQWKNKKFPSRKSPESLDDTAFDAVSSKLADHDGGEWRTRTVDLPRVRRTL